jgi:iron complex outermembrane receptor protein
MRASSMIPAFGLLFIAASGASATGAPRSTVSVDTFPLITAVSEDSVRIVEADSIYYGNEDHPLQLEMITVFGRRVSRVAGADRIELDTELVESRDGGSVADLSTLLPSTKLTVNSRGESLFMVRGSSERHLRVELDGIPLTVPWDERVDLSLLPLLAIREVEARRGVTSVLDEPNTLAGTVALHTREQVLDGSASRVGGWAGEAGAWGVQGLHQRRSGRWSMLAAVDHRRRDGFVISKDIDPGLHQDPNRRLRLNSQLEQTSGLARIQRDFQDEGRWHVVVQASHGEKAVPPEEHIPDPRFWRYPTVQRILAGTRLELLLGQAWRLDTTASVDFFNQDIDSYPDREYLDRDAFEEDRDRTGFWRAGLARVIGENSDLRVRTTLRYSEHREITNASPDELLYSQLLMGAAGELEHRLGSGVTFRSGAGYEGARTPESGDKPRRDGDNEFAVQAAVEGRFARDGNWHLNGSHRPRMPSMRELYSGALGTFEPNDELEPERQNAVETGLSWEASSWNLSLNGFAQQINGAIERVTTATGLKQRVNLDEVRNLGLEFGSVFKPGHGLSFDLQTTWLYSRAKDDDGDFSRRVEDRPDWLATLAGTWTHRSGLRLRAELDGVGPRFSLDERKTDPTDPYTELDTALRLNLRLSWRDFGQFGGYAGSEWFVRVDNILDKVTFSQLGLVESGRMLQAGVRVDFDR